MKKHENTKKASSAAVYLYLFAALRTETAKHEAAETAKKAAETDEATKKASEAKREADEARAKQREAEREADEAKKMHEAAKKSEAADEATKREAANRHEAAKQKAREAKREADAKSAKHLALQKDADEARREADEQREAHEATKREALQILRCCAALHSVREVCKAVHRSSGMQAAYIAKTAAGKAARNAKTDYFARICFDIIMSENTNLHFMLNPCRLLETVESALFSYEEEAAAETYHAALLAIDEAADEAETENDEDAKILTFIDGIRKRARRAFWTACGGRDEEQHRFAEYDEESIVDEAETDEESEAEKARRFALIREAIEKCRLAKSEAEIFTLRVQGEKLETIAERLEKKESTIKTTLFRVRKKLETYKQQRDEEEAAKFREAARKKREAKHEEESDEARREKYEAARKKRAADEAKQKAAYFKYLIEKLASLFDEETDETEMHEDSRKKRAETIGSGEQSEKPFNTKYLHG